MWQTWLAVGLGSAAGAWLRWQVGLWLNWRLNWLPLGTLCVNWVGAYAIGVVSSWLVRHPEWSALWRLTLITGFLGGLTTFSTFSAEVMGLLLAQRWGAALAVAALHVMGALLLTGLGIWTTHILMLPR